MIKVLIVEDNFFVAEINKKYLDCIEGLSVVGIANDGLTAFEFCQNNVIDLVILDIYMPRMNGLELLKKIQRYYSKIKVIFVTVSTDPKHIDEAFKLGALDYLTKPFDYDNLKESITLYKDNYIWLNDKKGIN